jgi:hypothetical protein
MPEADSLTALRQAATALIGVAAAPTVLAALRMLLDGTETAFEERPAEKQATPSVPPRPAPRATAPLDATWDTDRKKFRAAMLERNVGYPALAETVGVSRNTLQNTLGKRASPTHALRARLTTWLQTELAPVVATAEPTFRLTGRGNGAGRVNTGRGDAAELAVAG